MEIRYISKEDKEFWYQLDKHLPETEFEKKHSIFTGRSDIKNVADLPLIYRDTSSRWK